MGRPRASSVLGVRIGSIVCIDEFMSNKYGTSQSWVRYRCDCGNESECRRYDFLKVNGKSKSCGCIQDINLKLAIEKDFTGQRFGRLVALERIPPGDDGYGARYLCHCDCGNDKIILGSHLSHKTWPTESCGCINKENISKIGSRQIGKSSPTWKGGPDFTWYDTYADKLFLVEQIRRNEENPNFLECVCTYCGRWFLPKMSVVVKRIDAINGKGTGECRFYCCDSCKKNCSIYAQKKWPKGYKPATSREVQPELRQLAFARDDYTCQRCGSKDNLHCHHIEGININPLESADVDLTITVCSDCHKWIHKQKDCRYIDLQCKKDAA